MVRHTLLLGELLSDLTIDNAIICEVEFVADESRWDRLLTFLLLDAPNFTQPLFDFRE